MLALLANSPTVGQSAALLAVGVLAGVLGGALGIGGGLIMIPAMVLILDRAYGPNSFHLFKLSALTTAVILSLPAVGQHLRARAVVKDMIPTLITWALVGVAAGVWFSLGLIDERTGTLRRAFGLFMLAAVAAKLWQSRTAAERRFSQPGAACPVPRSRRGFIGLVGGLPAGLIGGLLGVGGGIWAVPAQNYLLRLRLPNAIANSACMVVALAGGGAILQSWAIWHMSGVRIADALWLVLWLAPGALLGGWLGGGLTHKLPVAWLRNVFYVILAITGLRLAWG